MATKQPPPSASTSGAAVSMKDYLKRYQSGPAAADQKKAKKKKKSKPNAPAGAGVLIVDEDPVWQKPVHIEEDEPASDERPQVNEDIEVKRMRRMEEIRAKRPYNSIANDGSGWVNVPGPQDGGSPRCRRNDTPSPERGTGARRKDLSPPRRRQRRDTPSPKHGSAAGTDLSPPRQRQRRRDTPSPEGKRGTAEGGDLSPPRKLRWQEDHSPPRRRARHDSEEPQDLSPARRRTRHDSEEPQDLSPPRRRTRHDSEEPKDFSPPRRRTRHDSEDRKDHSPPRRQTRQDTKEPEDISPPRRRKRQDSTQLDDLSPPRRQKNGTRPGGWGHFTTKEGFAAQDPSFTGKGAKAVFRDKEGKRINQEDIQKAKGDEKPKEKHIEWGKGLVQKRAAEARVQDLEDEKSKPFARTRDDPELDNMLKNRLRWGDPMAHLVKRKEDFLLDDLGDDEKMKESGFIVPQNVPTHSWLKRGVDPPLNRYGIKPGRHWDGVDRSNGYEKDMYKLKNDKQAMEQEAYLWSVADIVTFSPSQERNMFSRRRLLSLLRSVRLAPAGRLAAAPSSRSFSLLPAAAASTSGSGSSDGSFSNKGSKYGAILIGQAAVFLGLSSNAVLAQDDSVAPSDSSDQADANATGLRRIEDGSVISNEHTIKWRMCTDNARDYFLKATEAEKLFKAALQEAKEGFGLRDPHVASALNNLAEFYRLRKEYEKAEPLYMEAIEILEQSFGPDDIRVGTALRNLGQYYHIQRRFDQGQTCYEVPAVNS
ncbi:hypothetical protein ACQ4PT_032922 [Festuca glaucescens]